MKVISPHDIVLSSTNVAANSEAEWSSSTTYAIDDTVQVTTTTPHKVYKSLRGNNTNRPPADNLEPVEVSGTSVTSMAVSDGAKTITTQTGLGFDTGMVVKMSKTTTPNSVHATGEVTGYTSGTGVLLVTIYSTTGSGTHTDWTIVSDDEVGFWAEVESTEQWKMFDEYVNQGTTNLNTIEVEMDVTNADHVCLYGLDAATVDLYLWDITKTTLLWNTSIDLTYGASIIASISDWFEYFIGGYERLTDCSQEFGVMIYEGVLGVTITASTGEYASCGNLLVGRGYDIGCSQFDASIGMVDYGDWDIDPDTGRSSFTEGSWAKRNSLTTYLPNTDIDNVYKLLVSLRGTPTAWLGNNDSTDYELLKVFGSFVDFDIVISNHSHSFCSIELKGVI